MSSPAEILTSKAWRVFPRLVPQEELEVRQSPRPTSRRAPAAQPATAAAPAPKPPPPAAAPADTGENIKMAVLSVANLHEHGNLFVKYLKLRREIFIQGKQWALPEADGMEFDQYDTPQCRWVLLHEDGEILASVRIAPTTARCGLHSYMIRDAQLGQLSDLPLDLMYFAAPVGEQVWEGTRLFLSPDVPTSRRPLVHRRLLKALGDAGAGVGAKLVIALLPIMLIRWMNRVGMTTTGVGPELEIAGDKVQCALIDTRVLQTACSLPTRKTARRA